MEKDTPRALSIKIHKLEKKNDNLLDAYKDVHFGDDSMHKSYVITENEGCMYILVGRNFGRKTKGVLAPTPGGGFDEKKDAENDQNDAPAFKYNWK